MNQNVPESKPADQASSCSGLLESVKRYNEFTYWNEKTPSAWTVVGDYDCKRITTFVRSLTDDEVALWCDGYYTGQRHGVETGKIIKGNEVKRALGL